jgi:hypothetical protein
LITTPAAFRLSLPTLAKPERDRNAYSKILN